MCSLGYCHAFLLSTASVLVLETIGNTLTFIDYIKCSQFLSSILVQCLNLTETPARTVSHSRLLSLISLNIESRVTSVSPCVLYATLYSFQTREEKTKYSDLMLTLVKNGPPHFSTHNIINGSL